jgi:hypothetical protein
VVRKKLKLKLNSMKVEVDGHRLYCIDPVFPRGSHHIRTGLRPRSNCIGGTGFLGPETNRPKSPSGQKRSQRRPKRSRKSPPFVGFLAVSGKSSGSKECVVGSAATELSCGSRRRLLPGSYMKAPALWTHGNPEHLIIITSDPDHLPIGVLSLESSVQGIRAA